MVKTNKSTYLSNLINDIRLSVKLWQREGTRAFINRGYWYLKGYRLSEDIPSGLFNRKHKHFRKKIPIAFQPSDAPLVSIIIPVYNQWDYTYDCLHSIYDNTPGTDFELLIADDVSTDETRNLGKYVKNVHIIRNETNLGFLKNVNRASTFARGKYLFLLNNDTQVTENWLDSIMDLMEKDPTVGLAGSKLIFANGKLQEAGGVIFQDGSGLNYGRLKDPELPEFNYLKEVDYCSGAGICIRKEIWDRLGGFDERFAPAYYEDTDLAFAVRSMGYKVVYQPRSVIFHFEGISHGRDIQSGIKKKQAENRSVFVEKWNKVLLKEHSQDTREIFAARDRSQRKKTLVMLDHYIPKPDQDAGSRSTYQYLMLFCQMGLNVKFIPDNFKKDEKYLEKLEQAGIEVLYGANYRDSIFDWLRQNDRFIDFIYLNRPNVSIKYIDFIKEHLRAKVIYQPHDLHFLRLAREYEVTGDINSRNASAKWKMIEEKLVKSADVNLTFSSFEQEVIERTFLVKNCHIVPLFIFDDFPDHDKNFENCKDLLFVGGFHHPPNEDAVYWFIQDIFPSVRRNIPGIRLHLVGSKMSDKNRVIKDKSIIIHGLISDEDLAALYRSVKIIILPLRFGAGVKGKLVEALYHGAPVVATEIALEGIPDIHNIIRAFNSSTEIIDEITRIYNNNHLLEDLSHNNQEFAKKYFSKKSFKKVLGELLQIEYLTSDY